MIFWILLHHHRTTGSCLYEVGYPGIRSVRTCWQHAPCLFSGYQQSVRALQLYTLKSRSTSTSSGACTLKHSRQIFEPSRHFCYCPYSCTVLRSTYYCISLARVPGTRYSSVCITFHSIVTCTLLSQPLEKIENVLNRYNIQKVWAKICST